MAAATTPRYGTEDAIDEDNEGAIDDDNEAGARPTRGRRDHSAALERRWQRAERVERACAGYERAHEMAAGSASIAEARGWAPSGKGDAGKGDAGKGDAAGGLGLETRGWAPSGKGDAVGGLGLETRDTLAHKVAWSASDDGYKRNIGEALGLRTLENNGDGNCFFESLQQGLEAIGHAGAGDSVALIRNKLVDALERDGVRVDFIASDDADVLANRFDVDEAAMGTAEGRLREWARYLQHLRTDRVWANNLCVPAVPAVYGVSLSIFQSAASQGVASYTPVGGGAAGRDVYMYCNDRHFNAMVRGAVARGGLESQSMAELDEELRKTLRGIKAMERLERSARTQRKKERRIGMILELLEHSDDVDPEKTEVLLDMLQTLMG